MDDGAAGLDDSAHFPPQPRGVSFKLHINTVSHPPTSPPHEINTHMDGADGYQKLPGDVFLSPRMGYAENYAPKQPVEPANMASRSPKSRNPSSSIYKPEQQPLTARLARPPRYNRQSKIDRSIGSHYESSMLGGVQPGAKFAQSTWQGCRHRFRAQAPDPAFRFQTVAQFGEESITDVSKAALSFSQMPRFPDVSWRDQDYQDELANMDTMVAVNKKNKYQEFSFRPRNFGPPVSSEDVAWRSKMGPGYYHVASKYNMAKMKFSQIARWDHDHEGDDVGPGKYNLDKYNSLNDAPGFMMPVNEVASIDIALDPDAPPRRQGEAIGKFIRRVKEKDFHPDASMMRQMLTARTHTEQMAKVKKQREQLHADRREHKADLCGKWDRIKIENGKQAKQRAIRQRAAAQIASNALVLTSHATRARRMGAVLVSYRKKQKEDKLTEKCASTIQRCYRKHSRWTRLLSFKRFQEFKETISSFIFHKQFSVRMNRRRLAAKAIYTFAAEVQQADGLRIMCQQYRQMVITAQRMIRKFLAVRKAQTHIIGLLYQQKAEEFKDTNHAASKWLLIPEPVVNRLVWGDIKARRNYHKELSTDEAEEAALDDAWNLVHGVAEEAPCVDFKIMPSTEHILSVMEEVYKQYKGTFFE